MQCDWRFKQIEGQCIHYIWPPDAITVLGSILIFFIVGVSSIAGLGGGGPTLVVLLIAFNFTAKDSTIVVFVCILGATLGNTLTQMRKSLNGKPLIKYQYAFVSIPIMFTGSFVGVMMNKLLPSLITCSFILIVIGIPMKNILTKFIEGYKKQSEQNLQQISNRNQQQTINPFSSNRNRYIFFNIGFLIFVYIFLEIIRGSERFPSIFQIQICSPLYWVLYAISISLTAFFAVFNYQSLTMWKTQNSNEMVKESMVSQVQNPIVNHKLSFIGYSVFGGMFSGFGLGGGIFLVPMYRNLGMNPLEATSTCAFGVFITAIINCFQGIFFGVITISDLIYFLTLSCLGSFILSKIISSYLQKINRLSIVQLILFLLLIFSIINIPYSLWFKYQRSGYNLDTILAFGHLC